MTRETVVLVTGVGGAGVGEQILKALKLSGLPLEVVVTDSRQMSLGFSSAQHCYWIPPADHDEYLEALLDLCATHEVQAVFPGSEPELRRISADRDAFINRGIVLPISPAHVIDLCMDKHLSTAWLRDHGYVVPATTLVESQDDLASIDYFPAVLKPHLGGGGSANIMLAQTAEELIVFGGFLLASLGSFIVQEYVGTESDEFTVGVLSDLDGNLVDSIAVRRDITSGLSNRIRVPNRTSRAELGPMLSISSGVSQGQVDTYREVTAEAERIAADLGSTGAINIQCRLSEGRPVVFEINPRFSGTTSVRALVGYNEPGWLLRRHVLGEDLEGRIGYRSGLVMRGLVEGIGVSADRPERW
ncbi:ATP-grasp domain-containing protein [Nocardioides marmorisolisilvae]|uniref:ATP-grasp domain-containing protein n=1 Tax=Nocardioides marmorisolisilvae TaxID=1542737 RepID=A0A3N0DTY4_9ACTN|nr:ATP-grasp domain-containing protein [Nocardioides marmorisolisilvae]RNL79070.1 ATP-grasp domain-containing protein [Nocardioides marmorisolisilvae]